MYSRKISWRLAASFVSMVDLTRLWGCLSDIGNDTDLCRFNQNAHVGPLGAARFGRGTDKLQKVIDKVDNSAAAVCTELAVRACLINEGETRDDPASPDGEGAERSGRFGVFRHLGGKAGLQSDLGVSTFIKEATEAGCAANHSSLSAI